MDFFCRKLKVWHYCSKIFVLTLNHPSCLQPYLSFVAWKKTNCNMHMDEVSLTDHMWLEFETILQDNQFIKKVNAKFLPRKVCVIDITKIGSMYNHYNHSYNWNIFGKSYWMKQNLNWYEKGKTTKFRVLEGHSSGRLTLHHTGEFNI
jgi:hypothetical protein